ncbi:hypothetical protein EON80_04995 [bacterium]|nr:MAG: hypothetical protein EON80_04995 [bacterium]
MQSEISLGLVGLGISLGLRHGIDWDHIAAITDIAGSSVPSEAEKSGHTRKTAREAFWLATCYALGHAAMVIGLGLLAIWASEFVPEWFDPLMERVVGVTLLVLGFWVFYSLWRFGTSFRLQSRWMVFFGLIERGWKKLTGKGHSHEVSKEFGRYGAPAAIGIGLIHGFGAETGTQALLLASVVGVTSQQAGSVLLVAFVIGLLVSNSIVAAFSVAGFISSRTRKLVYTGLGVTVAVFSLFVGTFFRCWSGRRLAGFAEGDRAGSGVA